MYNPTITIEANGFEENATWQRMVDFLSTYIDAINSGLIDPPERPVEITLTASDDLPSLLGGVNPGAGFANWSILPSTGEVFGGFVTLDPTHIFATGGIGRSNAENLLVHELSHVFYQEGHTSPRDGVFEAKVILDTWALGLKPNLNDVFNASINGEYPGRECFSAGTPITLSDGTTKPIEAITQSDVVLTHDADGNPIPGRVTKLFTNTTSEFIRLTFSDDRDDLVATPGHRFLTETGDYMEIGHMLRLGGGTVRVVDVDGSIIEAAGEVIAYSAETAHMFEQSATKTIAFEGNTVLKEDVEQGWTTYNFEVKEHHNYVAGGVRVHNDSILSTLQEGDQLVALSDDLRDAIILRDIDDDGAQDIVLLDGAPDLGGNTVITGTYRVIYGEAISIPFAGNFDLAEELLALIADSPTLASSPNSILALLDDIVPGVSFLSLFDDATGTFSGQTLDGIGSVIGGTAADDTLIGTSGDDIISGGLGNDLIKGLDGNDSLYGNSDNDRLEGGDDNDFLSGFAGADLLLGGSGDDLLRGGNGNDDLRGGSGNDDLGGQNGNDSLYGNSGDDTLSGGAGDDYLSGFTGNDSLYGNSGDDTLSGGAGDDYLSGFTGNDSLYGNSGDDRMFGSVGDDYLSGSSGDDELNGGSGNDGLRGGGDADTFIFAGGFGADVVFDFNTGQAGERIDLTGVTSIISFADLTTNHLSQSSSNAVIDAGNGNTITLNGVDMGSLTEDDFLF